MGPPTPTHPPLSKVTKPSRGQKRPVSPVFVMFKRFQPFSLQATPVIFIIPEPEENLEPSPKKKELETGYQLQQNWAEIVSLYNYCQTVEKTLHLLYFSQNVSVFISLVSICMIVCNNLLGALAILNRISPNPRNQRKRNRNRSQNHRNKTRLKRLEHCLAFSKGTEQVN